MCALNLRQIHKLCMQNSDNLTYTAARAAKEGMKSTNATIKKRE